MSDTTDLSFFTLLARQPSLAAAAQLLGVTPPAVSRRLAALEQRLGVRLLNRTTRRLSLTPQGERYLEHGEQILRPQCGIGGERQDRRVQSRRPLDDRRDFWRQSPHRVRRQRADASVACRRRGSKLFVQRRGRNLVGEFAALFESKDGAVRQHRAL